MTTAKLEEFLIQGRELEFSCCGHAFFMSPLFIDNVFSNEYYIYDNAEKSVVFKGCLHDILAYEFFPSISFKKAIHMFEFEYIL